MFTIKNTGSNYLARIVKLGPPRKHFNADKLLTHTILFNNIITDLSYKEGDLVVYFPLECQINKDFISYINGFQKKELNKDKEVRGFFDNNSRVRAVKLRGEPSAGFIIKLEVFIEWLTYAKSFDKKYFQDCVKLENIDFDCFNDILICQKYIVPVKNSQVQNPSKKKVKRESKIVEGQFRVAEDTAALKRNIDKINPDDIITISYKLHGTNSSIGRVLCKRKLSLVEKIAKFLGAKINDSIYDLVYASRTVIKNAYADKISASFYDTDIWAIHAEKIKDFIQDGITLYAEIVNQLPNGKWIQKGYCYGLPPGQSELFVYRITYTKPNGDIIEFTTPQIQRYCKKFDLKTVPIFYYGRAKDWINYVLNEKNLLLSGGQIEDLRDTTKHWHDNFLAALITQYNEKICYLCKSNVPEEGIVVTKESDFFEAYKLKSFAFLERETKELDSGEVNIEDSESQNTDNEEK